MLSFDKLTGEYNIKNTHSKIFLFYGSTSFNLIYRSQITKLFELVVFSLSAVSVPYPSHKK